MLDQLVESKSNSAENKRRTGFLAVVLVVVITLLTGGLLRSLFAKNFDMGDDSLALETLVAPVPVADEEPPPKPEKQPEKELSADVRKELIASIDMSPKDPPPLSTAKMTKATIRQEYNVRLGDADSNASVKAESGRGDVVKEGGPTG